MTGRHRLVGRPRIEQRRHDRPSRAAAGLGDGALDLGCGRGRKRRPQQRDGSRDERSRRARSAGCDRFASRPEAGDGFSRRPQSAPADRGAQVRGADRLAAKVARRDGDHPHMAGDGRAADGALVACRRDDDRAAVGRVAQRFFQLFLFVGRRRCDGDAQVDDPRARIDALGDRIGDLVGVALGISALSDAVSRKIGLTRSVQPGQIAGALEPLRAARMPAT